MEAADIAELGSLLRKLYPDGAYVRTLRSERDVAAEARYETALEELTQIIARGIAEHLLHEPRG